MQSSWRVPWRAVQHAIYTTVSGDIHLSISRWIIEDTPPSPCFLHRLELVVAPEYKDHVALEVRGANLFKFLFPHVVFLVTPPIFQFPSYESVAFPWYFTSTLKTLFKRIFPTYSAQLQFSCTCSSPHFPFLGKLLQSDFSVFLYWFFFFGWVVKYIYYL